MDILERLREFSFGTMALRLVLAMVCGGVLGYGRSRKERPAGLRTYMLACVAAAAAVLISLYEYEMLHGAWADDAGNAANKFDVAR